ncbi:TlpA family protein disulfide reductase [Flavobacterium granuli]|uniref:Thioredoxin-like n=1 Tax=Flavobacterium granuli TaxID=280093 RepID=A0A1M5TZD0_9FLAO|nr:TlpA disulfide reductase family protein [Flavobacterium granuli]PRZ22916.1 thioredoxin-like protein [Flavobacterium granuli]SHH56048.1 Thioredoxin-like [Flavobacterium granuli]
MKNILSIIILLSIALIGFGFQRTKIKHEPPKTVHLNIEKSDTILKWVILAEDQNDDFKESSLTKSKNENENLDFVFGLSAPKIFRFYGLKPMTAPRLVYITPGDSITYKLNDKNILVFEGPNAAHYNFFTKLDELHLPKLSYSEKEGVEKYKQSLEQNYKKKMSFLEKYIKNEKVSDMFSRKMRMVLKFQYIKSQLSCIPEEATINDAKYLNGIDLKLFNRNDQQDNGSFHLALMKYLHFASKIKDKSEAYSKEKLNYQLNLIDKNLSGDIREYAITKTLFEYDNHLKSENINLLQKTINNYLPQIKEKKYNEVLVQIRDRLIKFNSQLPEEVLNSKLMDIKGNSITLGEVLKQQGDKIKVIDFWASWCSPCIEEIKKSSKYRDKLIQENKVEFLYFSIDKDPEKWKKKVAELEKSGMDKNQYLIDVTTYSNLGSFLNISTIPRYAILDRTNKMFLSNAPSPIDNLQFNNIINQVNSLR